MAKIDSFQFGSIVIDGRKYGHDILIFPDGVVREREGGFWKFGSHVIRKAEVEELIRAKPELLIVGTGTSGRARVESELKASAAEANVELLITSSSEAINRLNQLIDEGKRAAALIHITC